jgi:hypothetical protein
MNIFQHLGIDLVLAVAHTARFSADTIRAIVHTFYSGMWG